MSEPSSLLVVAGEASGDRAAAAVVARLRALRERRGEDPAGLHVFGLGGGALEREGVDLVADLRDLLTGMGLTEIPRAAPRASGSRTRRSARGSPARSPALRCSSTTRSSTRGWSRRSGRGCRVLWYGAPQIWAWRANRGASLRKHVDRMAARSPVRGEALARPRRRCALRRTPRARGQGAHVRARSDRGAPGRARAPGMTRRAWAVAILPGSRPHEVRRLLAPMLAGYETVRREHASVDGRVLLAPSLDEDTRDWARALARQYRIDVVDVDARGGVSYGLAAFDAALCASGTASLECALARAVPIVCYRVGWLTERVARAALRTPHVALPNVLLGREGFPELLQDACGPDEIAEHLERKRPGRARVLPSRV